MRRLFLMVFAVCLFMAFGAGSASAAQGGEKGSGKPCPPASPLGQLLGPTNPGAPSCGKPGGGGGNPGTCHDNKDNDNDGKTDEQDPECQDPNDGVEDGSDIQAPSGNCASADLKLLTEDAKILCLYAPPNGNLATKEEECPDAEFASGPFLGGGLCIFLPPEST